MPDPSAVVRLHRPPLSAMICERWPMELPRREEFSTADGWMLDSAVVNAAASSAHITASYHAISALMSERPFGSAAELFGGMGCWSVIIQQLLTPATHLVSEVHPDAVAHLSAALAEYPVTVRQGDAFSSTPPDADLMALDMYDFTVHKLLNERAAWMRQIAGRRPKAILLTDAAGKFLHRHRALYSRELSCEVTDYPAYLTGLSDWLFRSYRYHTAACYYQPGSAVLALLRGPGENARVTEVPERPVGIRLEYGRK